jgi:hypothetical protein
MGDDRQEAPPPPLVAAAGGPPRRAWSRTAGRVIVYLVAGALNTVALLCVFFLWLAWLSGNYWTDRDLLENGAIWLVSMGLAGALSAGVSLLITGVAAKLRWMPRWAIALPGVLLTATLIAGCAMSDVYGSGQ